MIRQTEKALTIITRHTYQIGSHQGNCITITLEKLSRSKQTNQAMFRRREINESGAKDLVRIYRGEGCY